MERARSGYDAKLRQVSRFKPQITAPIGLENQPISKLFWVHPDNLTANDYNPNVVAPPEFKLLKVSLLADGWTMPVVVRETTPDEYEIVDGFHRWLLATDPDVFRLTDGLIPCVLVSPRDGEHQKMSTIRHNRARGSHHVLQMAEIVRQMLDDGIPRDEIATHLQMEPEEVDRLEDRGNMLKRGSDGEFGSGWKPV